MKKSLIYLFMLVCSVSMFASCGDDEDPLYPINTDLAGNYLGDFAVKVDGTQVGVTERQRVSIVQSTKGTNQIALSLKNFAFGGMALGNIDVDPCAVKAIDGGYSFEGQKTVNLVEPIGTCPVTVNGTVKGNKIDITVGVSVPALNQEVVAVFAGNKLTGNESSAAAITAFTFDNAVVTEQPVIDETNKTITFKVDVNATTEALSALVPTITISEKATVTPGSGVAQNFNNAVIYTVVAEDGTSVVYTVSVSGNSLKYSFDEWGTVSGTFNMLINTTNYSWDFPLPTNELASANEGIAALRTALGGSYTGAYATVKEDVGYGESGSAVKLVTLDTRGVGVMVKAPAITPGSLFTGRFVFSLTGASDPLSLTKFGLPYSKKPLKLKGMYKYTPGTPFIDGSDKANVKTTEETDAPSINAVLYEAEDATGAEVTLTGNDINTSEYRVAYATLKDGSAKADWAAIDEDFVYVEGKSYNAAKKYKLAIVCSSSKEGDVFRGGANSTLIVDNLEVVGE